MKLYFKKKYLKEKINLSLSYIGIGFVSIIWGGYTFLFVFVFYGIIAGVLYYYWKNKGYVKIDEHGITKYKFIPKTIAWQDFKGMRYYTDSLKILGESRSFYIDKDYLSEADLQQLEQKIKSRLPQRLKT